MSLKEKIKLYYIDLIKGKKKGAHVALFSFLLLLFSFIYGFFVKLILSCYRTGLFKSYKVDCRVISVGNITWGGTGKTPLVESLTKFFKQQEKKSAILIRGYGKDELYMLKDKFKDVPVIAGRDRIKTARDAQGHHQVNTIILDDGFQHLRLKRDLDIVLIDATCPFGNRRLIPRGILREPLSSLERASIFVLNKTNEVSRDLGLIEKELRKYNSQAPIFATMYVPKALRNLNTNESIELSEIKGQQVALLCGIAHPESLAKTVDSLGAQISLKFYFSDHYRYTQEDLRQIERKCLTNQVKILVTTEKDIPRLKPLLESVRLKIELYALCIELKIKDEEKFFELLVSKQEVKRLYSILILSDGKAGHLSQSKAIAKIIQKRKTDEGISENEIDTKVIEVKFRNRFCQTLLAFCSIFSGPSCFRCLRCLRFCLEKNSYAQLRHIPANIIISAGSSLSSVNLLLSYKNQARKVILMKPSFLNLDRFDLVIVPEHDRIKPRDNVLVTRIAPNLIDREFLQDKANALKKRLNLADNQSQKQGPTIGVLIGGDTAKYSLTMHLADKIVTQLKEVAANLNCQILVTTSRRTPKEIEKLFKENLSNFPPCKLLIIANEKNIPEAVGGILGLSDIIVVSGESISMVSEAVSSEKFVLAFIPEKKTKTITKQERFLKGLEKDRILSIIQPDNLSSKIEKIWQEKPPIKKIQDKGLIYQAITEFLQN